MRSVAPPALGTAAWTDPIVLGATGGAWVFPEERVIYTQSRCAMVSAADVDTLVDFFLWLGDHFPTDDAPVIVHDWRSIRSVPREARARFVERRRELKTRPKRVVIASEMNPVLRMALRTVSLAAQLVAQTVELDLVDDPEREIAELPLPDPGLHARLRLAYKRAHG